MPRDILAAQFNTIFTELLTIQLKAGGASMEPRTPDFLCKC